MSDNETGQVSENAAKIYEEFYLPALFEEWSPRVAEAAQIVNGHRVVDVACGTGALTLVVSDRVGSEGSVVGVDINEGMLNIAKMKAPQLDWKQAPAEALPFDSNSFDSAVCQFGLMYFGNQQRALQEMIRVLRPGGTLAIVVWDKLENNPGFAAEDQLWQQFIGEEAVDETYYSLGDKQVLEKLFTSSGISDAEIRTHQGTAQFSSIENWILTGVKGWTQDDAFSEDQLELLLQKAQIELASFETPGGSVAFPTSANIITASKPFDV
jgi:ubiquinone/menaquinone biosynthesis C-methylase UbiE